MATSMITLAIKSITAQLAAIPYDGWRTLKIAKAKKNVLFQQSAVFNDQVRRQEAGQMIPSDYPQVYVQPMLGRAMKVGQTWLYPDAIFRIHIADWMLDDGAGGLDQNYQVFDWRDLVRTQMEGFWPRYCGCMTEASEEEDFDHEGVYHFTIDMKAAFTDLKGGILDPDQKKVIETDAYPFVETIGFNGELLPPVQTIYGWKVCPIQVLIVDVVDPDAVNQILANGDVIPVQYVLNADGTLTIPELNKYIGVSVLTPFVVNNQNVDTVTWEYNSTEGVKVFDNTDGGGFNTGNDITFNASLPLHTP